MFGAEDVVGLCVIAKREDEEDGSEPPKVERS